MNGHDTNEKTQQVFKHYGDSGGAASMISPPRRSAPRVFHLLSRIIKVYFDFRFACLTRFDQRLISVCKKSANSRVESIGDGSRP